jgi:hypothetical protein
MWFHPKTPLLWKFTIASNAETYLGFHVKFLMFPLEFNRIWIILSYHIKNPQYGNPSSGTRAHTCGRTQTDTMKPKGAFLDYANAPNTMRQYTESSNKHDM